jgi:hypothetical protein
MISLMISLMFYEVPGYNHPVMEKQIERIATGETLKAATG